MKSYLISDNQDALIGLRLAGIEGLFVKNEQEAEMALEKMLGNNGLEILIVTENVFMMLEEKITKIKISSNKPLIVEIPDAKGSQRGDYIINIIRESIGLKI